MTEIQSVKQIGSGPFEPPSREDLERIAKGAFMAFLGFAAAYITTDMIPQLDQKNVIGMLLVSVLSVAANAIRVWSQDTRDVIGEPVRIEIPSVSIAPSIPISPPSAPSVPVAPSTPQVNGEIDVGGVSPL